MNETKHTTKHTTILYSFNHYYNYIPRRLKHDLQNDNFCTKSINLQVSIQQLYWEHALIHTANVIKPIVYMQGN